ncbi:unnamed protein product, partial [Chrysoparadoxa australica]
MVPETLSMGDPEKGPFAGLIPPKFTFQGDKLHLALHGLHQKMVQVEGQVRLNADQLLSRAQEERKIIASMQKEADAIEAEQAKTPRKEDTFTTAESDEARFQALHAQIQGLRNKNEVLTKTQRRWVQAQAERDGAQEACRKLEMSRMALQLQSKASQADLRKLAHAEEAMSIKLEEMFKSLLEEAMQEMRDQMERQMEEVAGAISSMQGQMDSLTGEGSDGDSSLYGSSMGRSGFGGGLSSQKTMRNLIDEANFEDLDVDELDEGQVFELASKGAFIKNKTQLLKAEDEEVQQLKEAMEEVSHVQEASIKDMKENFRKITLQLETTKAEETEAITSCVRAQQDMEKRIEELEGALRDREDEVAELRGDLKAAEQAVDEMGEQLEAAMADQAEEIKRECGEEAIDLVKDAAAGTEEKIKLELEELRDQCLKPTQECQAAISEITTKVETAAKEAEAAAAASETELKSILQQRAVAQLKEMGDFKEHVDKVEAEGQQKLEELKDDVRLKQTELAGAVADAVKASRETGTHCIAQLNEAREAVSAMRAEQAVQRKEIRSSAEMLEKDLKNSLKMVVPDVGRLRTLEDVGEAIGHAMADQRDRTSTLERQGINLALIARQAEQAVQTFARKELMWQGVDLKLTAHSRGLRDVALGVERASLSTPGNQFTLTTEAARSLAGDMQRIGKLIAQKADYEVIREINKSEKPEDEAEGWDDRVLLLRGQYLAKFIANGKELLQKKSPEPSKAAEGVRQIFFQKVENSLKIVMSKYNATSPGTTLFGRIRMQPKACVACDRPFTKSTNGGSTAPIGGNAAAVPAEPLPDEHSFRTTKTFRPYTSTQSRGAIKSRTGLYGASQGLGGDSLSYSQTYGTNATGKDGQQYIYHAGFKLPKTLRSPVSLEDDGSLSLTLTQTQASRALGTLPQLEDDTRRDSKGQRSGFPVGDDTSLMSAVTYSSTDFGPLSLEQQQQQETMQRSESAPYFQ